MKYILSLFFLLLIAFPSRGQMDISREYAKASLLYHDGDLINAEKIFSEICKVENGNSLRDSHLCTLAEIDCYMGEYNKADSILLHLLEKNDPYYHNSYAYEIALNKIGELYTQTYRYEEAEKYLQESLQLANEKYGKKSEEYITALLYLVQLYMYQDNTPEAEKLIKEAGKKIKSYKDQDRLMAHYYHLKGLLYYYSGDMEKAEKEVVKAIEFCDEEGIGNIPISYTLRLTLPTIYLSLSKYREAENILTRLIPVIEKNFGKKSAFYYRAKDDLAMSYIALSQYQKAIDLYIDLICDLYEYHGNTDYSHYTSINLTYGLGKAYHYAGDFNNAINQYKESVKWRRKLFGDNSIFVVNAVINIGSLYEKMKNWDEANALYSEASDFFERNKEYKSHLLYPLLLLNQTSVCMERGFFSMAQDKLNETEALLKKMEIGKNHILYRNYINTLSVLKYRQNSKDESLEAIFLESLRLTESAEGKGQIYAFELLNLGSYYQENGNLQKAIETKEQALKILEEVAGNNPSFYFHLIEFAIDHERMGNFSVAQECFRKAIDKIQTYAETNLAYLSSNERNTYWDYTTLAFDVLFDCVNRNKEKHPEIIDIGYDSRLFSNSLLLDIERKYQELADTKTDNEEQNGLNRELLARNEELKEYEETLDKIRKQILITLFDSSYELTKELLSNYENDIDVDEILELIYPFEEETKELLEMKAEYLIDLNKLKKLNDQETQQLIDEIEGELEKIKELEDEFVKVIEYTRSEMTQVVLLATNFPSREIETVVAKLDNKELMDQYRQGVDLYKKKQRLADEIREMRRNTNANLSFKLKKDISWSDVKQSLEDQDAAIEFVRFISVEQETYVYAAMILRPDFEHPQMIELCKEGQLISTISESPEDIYELIWKPIENYLGGATNIYIAASGLLHNVSFAGIKKEEQYLIDVYNIHNLLSTRDVVVQKQSDTSSLKTKSMSLFGGADYGLPASELLALNHNINRDPTRGQGFGYLPGSRKEVEMINQLLSDMNWETFLFVDLEATETKFKSLSSNSPSVIHISTHGYYFSKTEDADYESLRNRGASVNKYQQSIDPLMRSGLAFTGANHAWQGKEITADIDDGILTAHEVANMNLSNTDLVVLSACDTGLGDIVGGEGVYGLQRAFRLAGVDSMIVSLWKVPDKETVELMSLFYSEWTSGKTIRNAFVAAQKKMRETYPEEPRKWAGFVLIE
ncbi:CHAT domain-containing protein [Bacteroidales bacterium OttesenSCG-928-M11]|nr:CHAT domain-containing protein [Bacteroidales bacterium OttesenSCG-928-M11]